MAFPDIFEPITSLDLKARLEQLKSDSHAQWGRMNVAQMLAHCCTPYDQIEGRTGGGSWLLRLLARHFFKESAVGEMHFRKNIPTPKSFVISDPRDFERERKRLTALIDATHTQPAAAFEGKCHVTFGRLTAKEWSNLLYKHLDHHLRQFGA
jgi:hypothetical protein